MNITFAPDQDSREDGAESEVTLQTANDLYMRAQAALKANDKQTAARLLKASTVLLGQEVGLAPDHPNAIKKETEIEKLRKKLVEGWIDVADLSQATGVDKNRIHALLARLRNSQGAKIEKRTLNLYRIAS